MAHFWQDWMLLVVTSSKPVKHWLHFESEPLMRKELQPIHWVGSLLKEQLEHEESQVPLTNSQVAIDHLPEPRNAKLTEREVTLRYETRITTANL
jgi:hypothetical protein